MKYWALSPHLHLTHLMGTDTALLKPFHSLITSKDS